MNKRKIIYSSLTILSALALIVFLIIFHFQNPVLKVAFLDIGQGDSILISRGSSQVLIDGGPNEERLLEKLGRFIPFWDRKIEAVIITHPDQDHIEGLIGAVKNYQIGAVMENFQSSDSQVYKKLKEIIAEKNIPTLSVEKDDEIEFSNGAALKIIYALKGGENSRETNEKSVVSQLIFGGNSFLFTGDLPGAEETGLENVQADVLKVAHHGSKYSTGEDFLKKVGPRETVISVGANNRYGHPAPEILERLEKSGATILRTDRTGDVVYVCGQPEELCAREK